MKQILAAALLLISAASAFAQKTTECSVIGTVVDRSGKPFPNAYMLLDTPPAGWEDLIVPDHSDENGNFEISATCPFPDGKMTLYVSSPFSFDNFSPFTPPFTRTNRLGKSFVGQPVVNRTKRDINLGKVYIQVYFSPVLVRFTDQSGNPLIKTKDDWLNVWIRLRLGNRTVAESTLSLINIEKAVRLDESAAKINLPEGEWTIEISPDGKHWLTPDRSVTVPGSVPESGFTLKMSKK